MNNSGGASSGSGTGVAHDYGVGVGDDSTRRKSISSSSTSSSSSSSDASSGAGGMTLGMKILPTQLVSFGHLGRGASALVERMLLLPDMRVVAVKTLSVFQDAGRAQLVNEIRVFANSSSDDNVVGLLGAFSGEGCATLVLEHMNRGDLQSYVESHGPLPESAAREIAKQVLKGLRRLHSKYQVHRDLKPGNILLNSDGMVKLADFGLTHALSHTDDYTVTPGGTIVYLSPERVNKNVTTTASDIWAVGIVIYYVVTGKVPVPGEFWQLMKFMSSPEEDFPMRLDEKVFSAAMRDWLRQCLRKDHLTRATAAQLLQHPWILGQSHIPEPETTTSTSTAAHPEGKSAGGSASSSSSSSGGGVVVPPISPSDLPWTKLRQPSSKELAFLTNALFDTVWKGAKRAWTAQDLTRVNFIAREMGWVAEPVISAFEAKFKQANEAAAAAGAAAAAAGAAGAAPSVGGSAGTGLGPGILLTR